MAVMAMLIIVVTLPGQSDKELEESGFMDGSSHEGVVIF